MQSTNSEPKELANRRKLVQNYKIRIYETLDGPFPHPSLWAYHRIMFSRLMSTFFRKQPIIH